MKRLTTLPNPFDDPPKIDPRLTTEGELAALAVALGARGVPGWSSAEEALAADAPFVAPGRVAEVRRAIREGDDPLGDLFALTRCAVTRRERGATYTPLGLVRAMVDRAERHGIPERVVDPGLGSGRFLIEAGRRFGSVSLVGVELDPLAALLARANLATLGLAPRARVILHDYRSFRLEPTSGRTLFLGNPPYVRHHQISPEWKAWLTREAALRGLVASGLSGLHVHFLLATLAKAQPGDFGTFVTAAEWLDVNYGGLVRRLFLGELGGGEVVVVEPDARPFADADTTAAVITFEVGRKPVSVSFRRVDSPEGLRSGESREVTREQLEVEPRWSRLTRPARRAPADHVELGELCRVHRGQVTGANAVWIAGAHAAGLPPDLLFPSVTRARDLFRAGRRLDDPGALKSVIDLPNDLDEVDPADRPAVERFLDRARGLGVDLGYVARARRAWWSVGLRAPAPILATYMARRAPAFVRNGAAARHINVAHGLYPREFMPDDALDRLADHLNASAHTDDGRTYAGGLTKFEPREMERLLVPRPEELAAHAPV